MDADAGRRFVDTNVLVYLMSRDAAKWVRAEESLRTPVVVNVQVLNELTNVARRKTKRSWQEIDGFIDALSKLDTVEIRPLTRTVHDEGRRLAERYGFAFYDAVIVAAALDAGCTELLTEDMHTGLLVDGALTLVDPFAV